MQGISHITFVVADLERSTRLFVDVLGAEEVYASGDETFSVSREKFFLLGGVWIAIMQGEPGAARSYDHVAFKVDASELPALRRGIEALGLDIRPPRPRVAGEGESLYFHDFDNHLFELHTGTLAQRLERYARGRDGG